MGRENGGRTHEPSLRELTGQLDDLKELIRVRFDSVDKIMDERESRYLAQFKAMDDKTSIALTSSKEAVTKAETATEKRFDSVNEFRDTLRDQASTLLPRAEAETTFNTISEKVEDLKKDIQGLRDFRSISTGRDLSQTSSQLQTHWALGIVVSVALSFMAMSLTLYSIIRAGK